MLDSNAEHCFKLHAYDDSLDSRLRCQIDAAASGIDSITALADYGALVRQDVKD